MNEDLMKVVERIVRPLPCDKTTKNGMRADLYSQLERIFAEELVKDGDTVEALSRAQERFGETDQLQKELLGTISPLHRWQTAIDHWITGHREGRSTLRFATEFGLRAALTLTLFFAAMVGWGTWVWHDPIVLRVWPLFLAIAMLFGANCFTHVILGELALAAFRVDSLRMRLEKPVLLIASAMGAGLSLDLSMFVMLEVASPGMYWENVPGVFLWPMGATIVLFLIVVGLLAKVELEDRRWSQLQLD